jgi:mannose-binding lectin 2
LPGDAFGSKDQFTGLGVFFDTYANQKQRFAFPFIGAMIGDGQKRYNIPDDNVSQNLAQCEVSYQGYFSFSSLESHW